MKPKHILTLLVAIVIIAAVAYTLTSTDSPEAYIEKVEAERERQFKFIRFNAESPLTESQKQSFTKLEFYPIDPTYKVKALMVTIENKKVREVPLTDGSKERYIEHSWAEFEIQGKPQRLLLMQSMDESDKRNFFLAFADETSGVETYGGGRYINARQDGKSSITLDFNLAYNPYCAYNPDYACPIPPRENILEIPIPAGEKNYDK
ncbi:hypothetical protein FHS59_000194 [Algoriphagus iocasae]|uniref:DUF1684 domain-containing protein n=1 Tax=Algoriphagus iocasae TaxID=1836499 RepID=A0A841MGX5_9BACT|nr:DUF1684 domain-containing protein [Algoriphagus iocasae]MBB6324579.1 hypothetical protein [Algoriphagus iocasae]